MVLHSGRLFQYSKSEIYISLKSLTGSKTLVYLSRSKKKKFYNIAGFEKLVIEWVHDCGYRNLCNKGHIDKELIS
jgi:hypothetical protein